MTIHTEFRKGQRVFVKMKDGHSFVDKYKGRARNSVVLEEKGKIKINEIRFMSINNLKT